MNYLVQFNFILHGGISLYSEVTYTSKKRALACCKRNSDAKIFRRVSYREDSEYHCFRGLHWRRFMTN